MPYKHSWQLSSLWFVEGVALLRRGSPASGSLIDLYTLRRGYLATVSLIRNRGPLLLTDWSQTQLACMTWCLTVVLQQCGVLQQQWQVSVWASASCKGMHGHVVELGTVLVYLVRGNCILALQLYLGMMVLTCLCVEVLNSFHCQILFTVLGFFDKNPLAATM